MPKTVDTRSHCKVWLRACNKKPRCREGVAEDCCMLSTIPCSGFFIYMYSFWHGVIPASYDFYTCFTHFSLTVSISTNRGLPSLALRMVFLPSADGYLPGYHSCVPYILCSCARSISEDTHVRNRTRDS